MHQPPKPASRQPRPIDGADIDTLAKLAEVVKDRLSHEIVDDSFDHAFGTEHAWHLEIEPEEVQVDYPLESEYLPVACSIHYRAGGCDGEHRGKCKPCCTEVDSWLEVKLVSLNWTNCGIIAQYRIEHE